MVSGNEAWGKGADPIVNRAVVDVHAALGKPFSELGIAEAVVEIPAHCQGYDLIRVTIAAEG